MHKDASRDDAWRRTSIFIISIDWFLKKRALQLGEAKQLVTDTPDVSEKQKIISATSKWSKDFLPLLFLNDVVVFIAFGFPIFRLCPPNWPGWVGQLLTYFMGALGLHFGLKRLKLLEDSYLELWQAGGVSSIPGLIATLPETAWLDRSPFAVERMELLNSLIQMPRAFEFIGEKEKRRVDKYSVSSYQLGKDRAKLRFEVLQLQGLLQNMKRMV